MSEARIPVPEFVGEKLDPYSKLSGPRFAVFHWSPLLTSVFLGEPWKFWLHVGCKRSFASLNKYEGRRVSHRACSMFADFRTIECFKAVDTLSLFCVACS